MRTKEEIRAEIIASLQRIKEVDLVEKGYLYGLLFALGYDLIEAQFFLSFNKGKSNNIDWGNDDTNEGDSIQPTWATRMATWGNDDD